MITSIQMPLQMLEEMKNKMVNVELRNGKQVKGKLLAYDLSLNLGIEIDGKESMIDGQQVVLVFF